MAKKVPQILIDSLKMVSKADSNQLHHMVETQMGKRYPKAFIDSALSRMSNHTDGRIQKNKVSMTDTNVTSIDSKYIYFLP